VQWRKRVFKALREGWRQGFHPVQGSQVEAKELNRVVLPAQATEEGVRDLVDGKLRSGELKERGLVEEWGMEDGKGH